MTATTTLPFTVDRTVVIRATPEIVFSYFTDSSRWAAWWGAGSSIDARPGGRVVLRYPNSPEAIGEVLEFDAPRRIVFSYGFASGAPIAPGASRVTIALERITGGTRVSVSHAVAESSLRNVVQGWGFQLTVLANVLSADLHRDADSLIDRWFAVWSETDSTTREATLRAIAGSDVRFNDQFSALNGIDELLTHIAMSQQFMPGVSIRRNGELRRCRDEVLVDWIATAADEQPRGAGTNVFELDERNRIVGVTGFWK